LPYALASKLKTKDFLPIISVISLFTLAFPVILPKTALSGGESRFYYF
jgi:hypothetical protein